MLVLIVELHVTFGQRFARFFVVFQMIGAQPHPGVLQVHVLVRDKKVALALLRPGGGKLRVLPLPGRQVHLLRPGGAKDQHG